MVAISALLTECHDDEPYLTTEESSEVSEGLGTAKGAVDLEKAPLCRRRSDVRKIRTLPPLHPQVVAGICRSQLSAPPRSTSEVSPQKKTRTQAAIQAIVTNGVRSVGLSSCRGIMVPSLRGRAATVDDRSRKCRVIRQGTIRSKGD